MLIAAWCAASCGRKPAPVALDPREPPARVLIVTDDRVSLRAVAWVELHAWLAAAARSDEELPEELRPARAAYARSLKDDADDTILEAATRALAACENARCAAAAVEPFGFGAAYALALPGFIERHWSERALLVWSAIEIAHSALGPRADALLLRVASDLAITWRDRSVVVDLVSESPPPGRRSLLPVLLGARSGCFIHARGESDDLQNARIVDCIGSRALLGGAITSPIHTELLERLGAEGERAWSVLVLHAVARAVTSVEPKLASVPRRSALAVEGAILDWLAREWGGAKEGRNAFIDRYVDAWRATRKPAAR